MRVFTIVAALSCLTATACSSTGRMARVDPALVSAHVSGRDFEDKKCEMVSVYKGDKAYAINLDCYRFDQADTKTAYQMASEAGAGGKLARNRLQHVLVNQANFVCQLEKGRIYANRAVLDSVLDFTSAGFSIVSTIVGGDKAKSIFSGVAGLATATRSNMNANLYQNQLVPAITRVMDTERKDLLIGLNARSKQELADYNTDEMIVLVNEYHRACSFEKGMQLLLNAALNKEGVDAIIRDINLRSNANTLTRQIESQLLLKKQMTAANVDTAKIDSTILALQTQFEEVSLKLAENRQSSQTVTTPDTAEADESAGQ